MAPTWCHKAYIEETKMSLSSTAESTAKQTPPSAPGNNNDPTDDYGVDDPWIFSPANPPHLL